MFSDLLRMMPGWFKVLFVLCILIGLGFLGFQIWAIIALIDIAGEAVQAIGD